MKNLIFIVLLISSYSLFAQEVESDYKKQLPDSQIQDLLKDNVCALVFLKEVVFPRSLYSTRVGQLRIDVFGTLTKFDTQLRIRKNRSIPIQYSRFYSGNFYICYELKQQESVALKCPIQSIHTDNRLNIGELTIEEFEALTEGDITIHCKSPTIEDL